MSYLKTIGHFALRNRWKLLIAGIVLLPIIGLTFAALSPAQIEYVTAEAERGDLRQTVEAVGTVISDRDLQLQFPSSGIVSQVYVKEGDIVTQGQRLAVLRAGNLAADVSSALARLQSAEADLRAKEQGSRPEEIAVSEAEVASRRASLELAQTTFANAEEAYEQSQLKLAALQSEAAISLSGYVNNAGSTATKELTAVLNALSSVRDVYSNNDVVDAIIKYNTADYDLLNASIQAVEKSVNNQYASGVSASDFTEAIALLESTRSIVTNGWSTVNRAFELMDRLPVTSYLTQSEKETFKSTISTQRSTLQTALNTLDSATKTLRDASASLSTQITAEEASLSAAKGTMDKAQSDIATYQASLQIAEAQLQLKRAPVRQTDLDAAAANVRQYRAALARAQADYSNTILTAPISGKITKVNVKPGEFTPAGAAVTMLGNSPFRVEMYVSEIDVPKVALTQTGSVELDAFRGTNFTLRVSEIDPAATDRDGVPKYRVRLDFVYKHDTLKIGMTGDAEILTGMEEDVVSVPVRSVLEKDDGTEYVRVQKEDGTIEERTVVTGMEGEAGNISVTNVEEGETIIILERK